MYSHHGTLCIISDILFYLQWILLNMRFLKTSRDANHPSLQKVLPTFFGTFLPTAFAAKAAQKAGGFRDAPAVETNTAHRVLTPTFIGLNFGVRIGQSGLSGDLLLSSWVLASF